MENPVITHESHAETRDVVAVDPVFISLDPHAEKVQVKAGTMAVVPHMTDEELEAADDAGVLLVPEGTVICAGQTLKREFYPKLSAIYTDAPFYEFKLPDLRGKFIVGVNADGEFMMGDAVIYFDDIPNCDPPSRSVYDA
jgi:hypothetical protein